MQVASAGTWAQEGSPASEGSAQAVRGRGLDLSMHRSRRLSVAMLEDADLVLAMEPEHRRTILELAPELVGRVAVLSDYLAQPGDAAIPVHDPFGGSMEAYEEVARRLEHHVNRILPALLTRVGLKP